MRRPAAATLTLFLAALLAGCTPGRGPAVDPADPGMHADVLVIGAGIAGLSAALEAADAGASVLVVEANSVGGGHAVKAGGFALVGTPLQEKRGYRDDPGTAAADLLAWGEDADEGWVRRYVEASRPEVHDWLAGFGVRFTFILDTPQHSIPRFHFAGGGAVNVVLPMLEAALSRPGIEFRFHTPAEELLVTDGAVRGARVRDARTGRASDVRAGAVIVATGGFQTNLDLVRETWRNDLPAPGRMYAGAGYFATGDGIELGRNAGADLVHMDRHTTFTTGRPDPEDPTGTRALLTQNPAAIWVDAGGHRFIDETAASKLADEAVLRLKPATHWIVFDREGARQLRVRDAVWLATGGGSRLLDDPRMVFRGDDLQSLAATAGLPAAALTKTVERYNRMLAAGLDEDFGRFSPVDPDPAARPVAEPPFYAIQLFPLTRKSLGGLRVDGQTRVLDAGGEPIPGLYAAGEVTGVAGINGRYGGEGTFLGPSVYMGRLAGRAAAPVGTGNDAGNASGAGGTLTPVTSGPVASGSAPNRGVRRSHGENEAEASIATMSREGLAARLAQSAPGYWHFEVAHRVVLERELECTACHSPGWPTAPAVGAGQQRLQLQSCKTCH